MPHFHRGAARVAALVALVVSASAYGQAYDRIAPHEPKTAPPPQVKAPAPPAAASSDSNEELLPALRGIVFVQNSAALNANGVAADADAPIKAPGNSLLSDARFVTQLRPFIGQPLTTDGLNRITRLTTEWYRKHDRPFVAIVVPPQNVSSGVVQVVAEDYRVGKVHAEGNRFFSGQLLQRESGLVAGQTLTLGEVKDSLARLNDNPFRTVTTRFQPGADPGSTDVVLATEDRFPARVYAAFDNGGVPSLGRNEWSVGANWGNFLGLDQQVSYQFTRSVPGLLSAHSASWMAPLGDSRLLVFGSYEKAEPDAGPDFGEEGKSGQVGLRFVRALPRVSLGAGLELTSSVQVGYDYKSTNNNLDFGGVQVFSSTVEVDQFPVSYVATLTDPYGQTAFDNQFVYSPGGITGDNTDAHFDTSQPGSAANYVYDRLTLTRVTFLPRGFSWVARVIGQVANRNLAFSEQLGAGGIDSVRAYSTDTALGSEGLLVTQEIRGPAFSLSKALGASRGPADQIQLGAFWDYAHVQQRTAIADQLDRADLSSVGLDLHATVGRFVDLRMDAGRQLRRAPGENDRAWRGDIALTFGF